jgi:hypothetical protein
VPRRFLALAYESGSQQTLLFGGGTDQVHLFADTWEWDGIGWTQRSPAASPSARNLHAMAYDAARQRVVLFGGETAAFTGSGDTWEWDGVNWVQRNPSVSPPARSSHALAYDTARQRIVLFGGATGAFTFVNDTWEWDGSAWVQSNPVTRPPARSAHAMAYDAGRQRTVLFGGSDNSQNPVVTYADTWEWDGVDWVQQVSSTSPDARSGHAMAYDVARQRTELFGGSPPASTLPFGDTWVRGNLVPATAAVIGSPCAGSSGPPVITSNLPWLGNEALVVDLLSARASAPCLFVLASGTQNTSLGGGCTLYVNGLLVPLVAATNPSGFASTQFPVPPALSLRGVAVYAQACVFDPMGSFAGLAMSAGLGLVLGD